LSGPEQGVRVVSLALQVGDQVGSL